MSSFFSSPSPPSQGIIPGPVPTKSDAEVQADATAERQRLAAQRGRASTILAGGASLGTAAGGRTLLGAGA